MRLTHHTEGILRAVFAVCFLIALFSLPASPVSGQSNQNAEIAVAVPLTGQGSTVFGQPAYEGVQLAIEEANAVGTEPHINLKAYDDKGSDDEAKAIAAQVVSSQASVVVGPVYSTASLAAGPVYAAANLASLPATATSDLITNNPTTFRVIFKNSDQGATLATYLVRVLGLQKATVFVVDSAYGNTLLDGFQTTAGSLNIDAKYYKFKTADQGVALAQQVAADASQRAVILLTLDPEGAKILATLRRLGVNGPFLGGDAFGDDAFNQLLAAEPEEKAHPGFFTDNLYGIAPVILDSANAETLAFADRFRAHFGHDPVWQTVAGYDAGTLAVAALRAVVAGSAAHADLNTQRTAVLSYLNSLNSPDKAQSGLLGPFWFDSQRARQQAIRIGRFFRGQFESAPLQLVPVINPDQTAISAGAVFEVSKNSYARLQRVVYTGVYLNEVPLIDLSKPSFNADFYLWLRFAPDNSPDVADPTDLIFPNMINGSFSHDHPAKYSKMPDGTEYWLWRVQGEFRNIFDLHRYPFDQQTLSLSYFNASATLDQIVYVKDLRSVKSIVPNLVISQNPSANESLSVAAPQAFDNLTQWDPIKATTRRDNLVTDSPLGDPTSVGVDQQRELSGFLVSVQVQRHTLATLTKTLLPLGLMTLIMFASLFFSSSFEEEKVTVAITGALSGAVLLSSINGELGNVGYTIAVEYVFYVFFGLSLLCIVAVLGAERLRIAGYKQTSLRIEHWTRIAFVVIIAAVIVAALLLLRQ